MHKQLYTNLANGAMVVTANQRLSALMRRQYDCYQQQQGCKTWASAIILPLNAWLSMLWHTMPQQCTLLNDLQEQYLWQKIIQQDQQQLPLIHLSDTITLVKQAWGLLQQWRIDPTKLTDQGNQDQQFFYAWAKQFQQQCQQQQLLSQTQLINTLSDQLADYRADLPAQCYFIGFDDYSPAMRYFMRQLGEYCKVIIEQQSFTSGQVQCIQLPDTLSEITQMAHWAKQQYQTNKNIRLGCIVPELSALRAEVTRVFTHVFCMENSLPVCQPSAPPFNISAGSPLHHYPLVHGALLVLNLLNPRMHRDQVSSLLLSPYLHLHTDDSQVAALVEKTLFEQPHEMIHLTTLLPIFNQLSKHYPQQTWSKRCAHLVNWLTQMNQTKTPADWCQTFSELLTIMGWPGMQSLNSLEYQLCNRWQQLDLSFNRMSLLEPTLDRQQAIRIFSGLVQRTIFQPQTQQDRSIQILGTLEAAGYQFDAMWIMGLDDEAWPAPPKPNPFIPYALQVSQQMPHADANREYQYSQQTLKRLLGSAKQIIISSPQQQGDKNLHPSRLLNHFEQTTVAINAGEPSYQYQQWQTQSLQYIEDDQAPIINQQTISHGGSRIFQLQAQCPFRAFAECRLQAKPLETKGIGIEAQQHGIWVHTILENLWTQLKNQHNLLQLTLEQQADLVDQLIDDLVTDGDVFLQIEKKRLQKLIAQWLTVERERPSFEVILQEKSEKIQIGSLTLNTQIDRVDKLSDGSYLLIDYKTGNTSVADWFGERPQAPQLPLYCVFTTTENNSHYAGMSFANLQLEQSKLAGLISEQYDYEKFPIEGIKPMDQLSKSYSLSWHNLCLQWQETLTQLANDYAQGIAKVDPVDEQACRYCQLSALCRIAE